MHAHGALSARRDLRLRWLWQRPRPQILTGRQIADVMGRARHRRGRVQHRPQYLLRRRWFGLRRRPEAYGLFLSAEYAAYKPFLFLCDPIPSAILADFKMMRSMHRQ